MAQDQSQVFVIIADSGGGDDHNPHATFGSAMARIGEEETGIEVWQMSRTDYEQGADATYVGKCVFERW